MSIDFGARTPESLAGRKEYQSEPRSPSSVASTSTPGVATSANSFIQAVAPADPQEGWRWYDTTNHEFKIYDENDSWEVVWPTSTTPGVSGSLSGWRGNFNQSNTYSQGDHFLTATRYIYFVVADITNQTIDVQPVLGGNFFMDSSGNIIAVRVTNPDDKTIIRSGSSTDVTASGLIPAAGDEVLFQGDGKVYKSKLHSNTFISYSDIPANSDWIDLTAAGTPGGGLTTSAGDTFQATTGINIPVDANSVAGVRFGGGTSWTIDATTTQDGGGVAALSTGVIPTGPFNLNNFLSSVGANSPDGKVIMDRIWGFVISNDDGGDWGDWQSPPISNIRNFKVRGTRMFALAAQSLGGPLGSINYQYFTCTFWVGDINWATRTITNWQKISGDNVLANATVNYIIGFDYDVDNEQLIFSITYGAIGRTYIYIYNLGVNSHTAIYRYIAAANNFLFSGWPQQFGLIGVIGTNRLIHHGDKIAILPSPTTAIPNPLISGSLDLPGSADTTTNYSSIKINPQHPSQVFMLKWSNGSVTLERATISIVAGAPVISDVTGVVALGSINVYDSESLATSGVGQGLLVTPRFHYNATNAASSWTIDATTTQDGGGVAALLGSVQTGPSNLNNLTSAVHGRSPNSKIVLDKVWGFAITNDDGISWGELAEAHWDLNSAYF